MLWPGFWDRKRVKMMGSTLAHRQGAPVKGEGKFDESVGNYKRCPPLQKGAAASGPAVLPKRNSLCTLDA